MSIKTTRVYLKRLEQKEIEEMNQTQQPLKMVNNITFCYEGEKRSGNDNKRK